MRNVELKARDPDPARTLELALALGAADEGEISQRDTYFGGSRARVKLREQTPGDDELIAYRRSDDDQARVSEYLRVAAPDAAALKEALDAAYGTKVVVAKKRRLLLWENVRIHLDAVDGLGSYMELEGLVDGDAEPARQRVERLRKELEIDDANLVSGSYSDLLLDTPRVLVDAARAVMANAHVPYSHFPVGAALRGAGGAIHVGTNVENAAYPQSQCAEASAIGTMIAAGETKITAIAVAAANVDVCPPCGGCRQRLSEFAGPDTPVYMGSKTTTLGALLPESFGVAELNA
ncbi:MAG: cytidine deaminase [Actinobacteria bacterium]|nr:MAG: cytidine deaminase [Actinomycetota bacterium]